MMPEGERKNFKDVDHADAESHLDPRRSTIRHHQKFRTRTQTLIRKANELWKECNAEVSLVVRRDSGKYYVYQSRNSMEWPPNIDEVYSSYPLAETYFPGGEQLMPTKNAPRRWKLVELKSKDRAHPVPTQEIESKSEKSYSTYIEGSRVEGVKKI
ncbi:hypothetical protein EYR41_006094 [Orbilia oligospora]|uniref:MADS-box domain-containing protein n=1 Tax=Orbilia oligospora TaxID=2813651 RepID=A0A8H2E3R4_ORBOL|nr:hypothetical protein EYR41_006094 [Orbilia oligospora]